MGLDQRGRIAGQWGVTIAAAREGQLLFLGSELPHQLAENDSTDPSTSCLIGTIAVC